MNPLFDFDENGWVGNPQRTADVRPVSTIPAAVGRWNVRPTERPLSKAATVAWIVTGLILLLVGVFSQVHVLVFAGAWAAAFPALFVEWKTNNRRILPTDRLLLDIPDDRDVCLVHLTIVRDGKTVGNDKGVVWFDGGLLLFNGHRTSFAIGGEDILPPAQWSHAQWSTLPDRFVPLRVDKGKAGIELVPLVDGKSSASPAEMRFLKSLYGFLRHPMPSQGPRQLPPLER